MHSHTASDTINVEGETSTMRDLSRRGLSRRTALRAAGAAAIGTAVSQLPRVARAHDLRPNDPAYSLDEYEGVVNRDVTIRQVYEWPNINNATIYNNISNGLNGFQFSYDLPSDRVQVVVQAFASAAHAGQIASGQQNPDQQTAAEIVAEVQAHLIPGGLLVPAGVGELVRLQDKGFRLVVNAQGSTDGVASHRRWP